MFLTQDCVVYFQIHTRTHARTHTRTHLYGGHLRIEMYLQLPSQCIVYKLYCKLPFPVGVPALQQLHRNALTVGRTIATMWVPGNEKNQ